MAEQGALLIFATMAVIGALRESPDKYNIIFDNTKYDDNNEYLEALRFLKILSRQMVDKTMVAAIREKESARRICCRGDRSGI